ncbi:hypothetical protein GUITHDRAFT_99775 [Guillardia theta CCMP2712]|uniref:Uncharacterized protein n=2 Tax=Guillardia theta TaxID=55529 RepID=L1K1S4_GUITC|nr:hypothetical protein GUITHDRAFT_99775 [Guillardia theta CCMP2712]EKX54298.1 hypothetical protein GUITHDRAFT_99775 [Guillardia theta CCMP2712]|eukprot:XP_005841278.1 hypothetical protein GUITHDRAFT_99775 [Guillardia theta CCMP2712]
MVVAMGHDEIVSLLLCLVPMYTAIAEVKADMSLQDSCMKIRGGSGARWNMAHDGFPVDELPDERIAWVKEEISRVNETIARVGEQIEAIDGKIEVAERNFISDPNMRSYWQEKKKQLREEKKQLREKKKQLREEEKQLFKKLDKLEGNGIRVLRTEYMSKSKGIGKTCFAYFLLLHILRSNEQVVYQIGTQYWYFDGRKWKIIKDWGNIPRNLIIGPEELLKEAAMEIDGCSDLERKIVVASNQDLGTPSKLIHLYPKSDYKTFTARICSNRAERIIFAQLVRHDRVQFVDLAFSRPGFENTPGSAFEYVAHEVLKRGGKFKLHRLQTDGDDEAAVKDLILKASQTFYEFPKSYGAMKDMVITYNTYCKPKARNFPCMDALSLSKSGVLYMFQMTGAGKHPIKLEPLYQILKALRVKNTIESVCFVFVLPEHLERKRSRRRAQSFKFEGSIPKELAEYNLTQYAMVLSKRVAIKSLNRGN